MTAMDIGCGLGYFSIGMAKIVGEKGKITAVDIQQKMLDILRKRAIKAGVSHLIRTVLCDEENIGTGEKSDFALSFWMAHETPDAFRLFKQVHGLLKKSGKFLLVEPKMHVSAAEFKKTLSSAHAAGFNITDSPFIFFSHTALFEKK